MNNDSQMIDALGGVTAVARRLGLKIPSGVSRVANWKRRGIPAKVKLENPWIYRDPKKAREPARKKD